MPFNKDQYQAYYQANKAKLNQQRTARRKLARLGQVETNQSEQVGTILPVETPEQVETRLRPKEVETTSGLGQVETPKRVETRLGQVETNPMPPPKKIETKLWADYYPAKKPYCYSCCQAGITEQEYQFCSEKQIAPANYACVVKHWTIYQNQTKREPQAKPTNSHQINQLFLE